MSKPFYYLWLYDPHTDQVILEHNEDRKPAYWVTHREMIHKFPSHDTILGYAYDIKGGWRITDWDHKKIDDPHILKEIREVLHHANKEQDKKHSKPSKASS